MAKVTVVVGPQGSGKTTEINKLVSGKEVMFAGSMSVLGLKSDPYYMQKLLLKAADKGKQVVVIEEMWAEPELIRSMMLSLLLIGYPVDVIIETQIPVKDIPFKDHINLIVKTIKNAKDN